MNARHFLLYNKNVSVRFCGISDVILLLKNVDCQVLCFVSSNKMSEKAGNLITIPRCQPLRVFIAATSSAKKGARGERGQ